MSEDATLDEFTTDKKERHAEETIDAVPESIAESSLDKTSAGQIPDDWIATRLGDIAEETEYGLTETAEDYDPEKPRYIRTQDFDDFGGLKEDSKASLPREKSKDGILQEGDLLFARSGSVGASLGKTYLYDTDDGDCCFGGYSIRHRLQGEGLNYKYISQYTLSNQYWDWVRRRAKTTAQSNINTGEYGTLLIPIPPLPEQRKIATVLYTVDQAIQKTEEIIGQKERVKRGLMQDIFRYGLTPSGEVRQSEDREPYEDTKYGTVPEGWEIVSLDSLVPDDAPVTYGIVKPGDHHPNGVPVVKVENIKNGKIDDDDLLHTDPEIHEKYKRAELQPGDLLFTIRGTVGRMAFVPDDLEGANLTQDTARIRVGDADPRFVRYYLETATPDNYFERHTKGQAVQGVNLEDLREVPVHLPTAGERERIIEILDSHTEQIQTERKYLNQLQRFKKGLMQDLLSGEVRTHDKDIEILDDVLQHG
ncbi:hypothetical protein BRD17_03305 [Halobacteriales archaeon SW_7_68_16]|nr:MAG: hypothetical protein BRD17_03305 [Halobacteriales archaeon SW_7_68_16]